MNTPQSVHSVEVIENSGIVSIVRMEDAALILDICDALYAGGVRCLEVPMTAPDAPGIIAQLGSRLAADAAIGAGTVLTEEDAQRVIDAGATFIVSPHFVPEVAAVAKGCGAALIPGAMTPAEIYHAHLGGADIIKVFPIRALGQAYISDVLGPYPELKLMPTGGITLEGAVSFIRAGACAVTVGRDLIGGGPWGPAAFAAIAERANALVAKIAEAKVG